MPHFPTMVTWVPSSRMPSLVQVMLSALVLLHKVTYSTYSVSIDISTLGLAYLGRRVVKRGCCMGQQEYRLCPLSLYMLYR